MRARCARSSSTGVALLYLVFFFNDTATTEIYTLSLHDALPICCIGHRLGVGHRVHCREPAERRDRKSTRLNSSHLVISYAVFCLKKKNSETLDITDIRRVLYPDAYIEWKSDDPNLWRGLDFGLFPSRKSAFFLNREEHRVIPTSPLKLCPPF